MSSGETDTAQSFWGHLDDLRSCLIKIGIVVIVLGIAAFLFKEELFAVILAPQKGDFITYRLIEKIGSLWGESPASFSIELINTGLARQFVAHMTAAVYAAVLCASPYILYQLFRFVSPALYVNEKKYVIRAVSYSYLLFMVGVLLSYFLIFPLTFRFLGTYQVSAEVANLITLQSYMETMMTITIMMGIVFEIPILCWLFGRLGILSADFMRHYRRHAIVLILIIAAVITPTAFLPSRSLHYPCMCYTSGASILSNTLHKNDEKSTDPFVKPETRRKFRHIVQPLYGRSTRERAQCRKNNFGR